MNRVKVKICGIRTVAAAQAAADAGADFIGLNFVPTSKRLITLGQAKKIVAALGPSRKVKIVGVFMNQQLEYIRQVSRTVPLDIIQLHGEEPPEFCAQIPLPIIKAFRLGAGFDVPEVARKMAQYNSELFLIDRLIPGAGSSLDLSLVSMLADNYPIMLAGGLTPENVAKAVEFTHSQGVDVAGGVETEGQQDAKKIKKFIHEIKSLF